MFDQRPMEVFASYVAAMFVGALMCAAMVFYGDVKVKNALRDREKKNDS